MIGVADSPLEGINLEEDKLGIGHYYAGLAEFIRSCETPMTISLQGSWGSGKTSAIHFVMNELKNSRVRCFEFNTWQFSQFDLGDQLVFTVLDELGSKLATDSKIKTSFKKRLLQIFSMTAPQVASAGATMLGAGGFSPAISEAIKEILSGEESPSIATQLAGLRSDFEDAVRNYCRANECDRIAIFIDDLDRLEPQRAIQLMECLKLFLDSKKCVFILAIDFEIVRQGVELKFRNDPGELKSRAFFDKMIQVPFRMPDGAYKMRSIISEFIQPEDKDKEEDLGIFEKAARLSVGNNPRSIKRLMNSYNLLRVIMRNQHSSTSFTYKNGNSLLFILQCAQAAFPKYYEELNRKAWGDGEGVVSLISAESSDGGNLEDYERWGIEPERSDLFDSFRDMLFENLSLADGQDTDDDETDQPLSIAALKECLAISAVTSVGSTSGDVGETSNIAAGDVLMDQLESHPYPTVELKELIRYFASQLAVRFNEIGPILLANPGDPTTRNWVMYKASSPAEVESKARVRRPKFGDFVFTRRSIEVRFGLSSRRNHVDDHNYSAGWVDFAQEIQIKFPEAEGSGTRMFATERNHGTPLALRNIQTREEVDEAITVLCEAYEISLGERVSARSDL